MEDDRRRLEEKQMHRERLIAEQKHEQKEVKVLKGCRELEIGNKRLRRFVLLCSINLVGWISQRVETSLISSKEE